MKRPEERTPRPEAWVKTKCKEIFHSFEIFFPYMPPANGMGRGGAADFIECVHGMYLAVECKATDGEQTKLQRLFQRKVQSQGGVYLLIYPHNLELLRDTLASLSFVPKT